MAEYNTTVTSYSEPSSQVQNVTSLSVAARYPGTQLYQQFIPEALHFSRVCLIVWLAVGLIGNALSAKIWLEPRMRKRNSSAIYVAALSINCIAFLILLLVNGLKYHWDIYLYHYPGGCELVNVLFFIPQYLTHLFVLGFTVDRYIAVCHPLKRKIFCRPSRAVKVILSMILGATLIACFQAYIYTYDHEKKKCVNRPTTVPVGILVDAWIWTIEMLFNLVAPLATIVLNILVIRGIRQFRKSRRLLEEQLAAQHMTVKGPESANGSAAQDGEQKHHQKTTSTLMLLSVSFFYVITTLPTTCLYIINHRFVRGDDKMTDEQVEADPTWTRFFQFREIEYIIYEVSKAHYACNFFIFLPTQRHFRQALAEFLFCVYKFFFCK